MKAAVLYANGDIRYGDWTTPVLGGDDGDENSVIVKVRAAGICGSDVPRVLNNASHYYPNVLGHEFAGEITETGSGVKNLRAGDRVAGVPLVPCGNCGDCLKGDFALCRYYGFIGSRSQGGFAEYIKLPESNAVKFDGSVSYEQGALFEPSTVALHGLRVNNYTGGRDAAVLGGGTIGIFTMQWAKIFGAKSVTVFDISDERLNLCGKLGADYIVNTKREETEINKNRYDFVFETAGSDETMRLAFEIAANKANVCFIGTPSKDLVFTPKLFENMNRKEFKLTGSWMSYSAPFPGEEWTLTAHYFKTGRLKFDDDMIFRRFKLNQAGEAFDLYKTPGEVKGKIIFVID
ncbi:MAG: galactitol-1-phosphate 5-dehydrogenase [Oscillospiraceae bacterium]|nr:galactitol-1-phosphate 5-dehydrogenase [Oscillospiraceae bacterium]